MASPIQYAAMLLVYVYRQQEKCKNLIGIPLQSATMSEQKARDSAKQAEPGKGLGDFSLNAPGSDNAGVAAMQAAQHPEHADSSPLTLLEVAGKSALYSGIQAPIEGFTQLVDHVAGSKVLGTPDLV